MSTDPTVHSSTDPTIGTDATPPTRPADPSEGTHATDPAVRDHSIDLATASGPAGSTQPVPGPTEPVATGGTETRGTGAAPEPLGGRFAVHLGGVGLANLADGIVAAGLPLVAVTFTRSPSLISLLTVAVWLPWLLLGLLAGVLVDRQDRRVVQLVGMGARALVLAGLAVLALSDRLSVGALIALAFAYGVTEVFVDLAAASIVPDLVPRSRLSAANGRVLGAQQVLSTFAGAPVGGLLVVLGAGWVAGVPAALCLAFVLLIGLGLRGSYRATPAHDDTGTQTPHVRREIMEGLRFLWRHPVLRPLLVSSGITNMANTAYFAVFVLWAVGPGSVVGLEPQHYPLLLALLAVGAVIGSLVVERLQRYVVEIRLMQVCWLVNAMTLLVPVVWPTPWAIGLAMGVLGFTNTMGNVVSQTVRQRLVPAHLLGRVGGAGRTLGYGLMPVGGLLGGLVAETLGLATVFVGAAVVCVLITLWVMTRVGQRDVDALEVPPHLAERAG